jgi:SulP family sulfate permease
VSPRVEVPASYVPVASASRAAARRGYGKVDLRADLIAGPTLGVVALPLSMALAIASGAPPEHGSIETARRSMPGGKRL